MDDLADWTLADEITAHGMGIMLDATDMCRLMVCMCRESYYFGKGIWAICPRCGRTVAAKTPEGLL